MIKLASVSSQSRLALIPAVGRASASLARGEAQPSRPMVTGRRGGDVAEVLRTVQRPSSYNVPHYPRNILRTLLNLSKHLQTPSAATDSRLSCSQGFTNFLSTP
ncbi:hypothetical protein E2C01_075141 [Portunus trituberculatus]|uniref:Uncharacterized protein n=1 Tax=Portunus trituberculatus TaxID=210409 RepID=A0A5B7I7Q6_PORTR|nr:hypothetical protein [Portunus trituberculatus]